MPEKQTQSPTNELADQLLGEVRAIALQLQPKLTSIQRATLDSQLGRDLGFDSLGRVELIARVEKVFQVHLPEQTFSDAETTRDLLRCLLYTSDAADE